MSAEAVFQAALLAALRTVPGLNGVYEGRPDKASEPWAELGELRSIDWSTKDAPGRELTTTLMLRDRSDSGAAVQALAAACDAAVLDIGRDLDGWRVASLVMVRTRIVRDPPRAWTALIEHRVRLLGPSGAV